MIDCIVDIERAGGQSSNNAMLCLTICWGGQQSNFGDWMKDASPEIRHRTLADHNLQQKGCTLGMATTTGMWRGVVPSILGSPEGGSARPNGHCFLCISNISDLKMI